ncbi:MAG: diguanylate cyclase [Thermoleophilaceae bacterium]|nr:diguanylate cyclase [Thermoleophilaceae bacterium]
MRLRLQALRRALARFEDPYGGSDIVIANRIGGLLWVLMGVLTLIVAPLAHPSARIGWPGWLLLGAISAASLAGGVWMLRGHRVEHGTLLGLSYLGVVTVAVLQLLAGTRFAYYQELYVPWTILTGALNPPRRLVPFMATVVAAAFSSALYADWRAGEVAEMVARLPVWFLLATMASIYASSQRATRAGLKREGEHARRLARVDTLTGLGNRRALEEALEAELSRSRRSGRPLSVLVIDVDGFKEINDRFGHLAGDEMLRSLGRAISGALRGEDACFRWGGDEFVVLLPETDAESAEAARGRISEAVARSCRRPCGAELTIGCGVAQLDEGMGPADLLAAADLSLVAAKERRSSPKTGLRSSRAL